MKKPQREQREPEEMLFVDGVQRLVPASMSTLRRWWRADPPAFPVPKRVGPKRLAWDRQAVLDWVAARPLVSRRANIATGDGDASVVAMVVAKANES